MPITKPEDFKTAFEYLGYNADEIESVDKFKESVDTDYIKRELADRDPIISKKVVGKELGKIETVFKKGLKDAGIEFNDGELKDKTIHDFMPLAFGKVAEMKKSLEGKAGQGSEEIVKDWTDKYQKLEAKTNDYKTQLEKTAGEFQTLQSNIITEKKQAIGKEYIKKAWDEYKWPNGVDELKKKGFQASISEKYKVELDENGKPFLADLNGARVPNPAKKDAFLDLSEVLVDEGLKNGVYAKAPDSKGSGFQNQNQQNQNFQNQTQGQSARQPHPDAVANS